MYVDSVAYVRVKGERKRMFHVRVWFEIRMQHVFLSSHPVYGCSNDRSENKDGMMVVRFLRRGKNGVAKPLICIKLGFVW